MSRLVPDVDKMWSIDYDHDLCGWTWSTYIIVQNRANIRANDIQALDFMSSMPIGMLLN